MLPGERRVAVLLPIRYAAFPQQEEAYLYFMNHKYKNQPVKQTN